MNFLFRADASTTIGYGHVVRCLALAEALARRSHDVAFICSDAPGNLIAQLRHRGIRVHEICETADDTAADAEQTSAALRGLTKEADWLIVDHYAIDSRWHRIMRSMTKHIMVIDDLADRDHDCDLLLDQNLAADSPVRYRSRIPDTSVKLFGPRYALLRQDFADERLRLRPRVGAADRVLLFFGGGDAENLTGMALGALTGRTADIVVGAGNPHREAIRALCEKEAGWDFHCQVDDMARLMARADIALGAGGSATWERCCLGLPTIACITADNQTAVTEEVAACGAQINLGWWENLDSERWRHALESVNTDALRDMSDCGMELVDGLGCQRVAAEVERIGSRI